MEIQKAAQYRSFYETAKKIKDAESRLAFYDALDAYRFEGVEPENLPFAADLAFTAIKPFIDADVNRKNGGAPKGNSNAKKQHENNSENNQENNLKTTTKQRVVFEKTNNEDDKEDVKENRPCPRRILQLFFYVLPELHDRKSA